MRIRKTQASLALRLWILGTVFAVILIDGIELVAWIALGGALALLWKVLPEEPEEPSERLPYQHLYEDRQFPRFDEPAAQPPSQDAAEARKKPD